MSDFFKTDDRVVIYPFRGRKREITINRSKYELLSCEYKDFSKQEFTFIIPVEVGVSQSLDLELLEGKGSENYYVLKIKGNDDFFEYNNSYVKEVVLSRGDEVRIGYNRLFFSS